ncbi:MAG: hypothetical protein ACK4HF_09520 [Paracoccaceae bacterium]
MRLSGIIPAYGDDRCSDASPFALGTRVLGAAVLMAALTGPVAAQQSMLEAVAQEVLTEFITTCGAVIADPAAFVAASAKIPDLRHVSSPDGAILVMAYDRTLVANNAHQLDVSIHIAAISEGVTYFMCGTNVPPVTTDFSALDIAFRTVIDASPGVRRVGGKTPHYSVIGRAGEAEYFTGHDNYLYFVTGWSTERPTLHMYSDIGMIGIELWTQIQIEAPR